MSEDREQERDGNDEAASRPSGAAARRERRASARPSARKGRGSAGSGSEASSAATTESKGRPTPSRDGRKQGRGSPFGVILRFLREVVAELRKVIWPTRKSLATYTLVVVVFSVIMVAFIAGLDVLFAKGVLWLFG